VHPAVVVKAMLLWLTQWAFHPAAE
jgi:hypothetical protein